MAEPLRPIGTRWEKVIHSPCNPNAPTWLATYEVVGHIAQMDGSLREDVRRIKFEKIHEGH